MNFFAHAVVAVRRDASLPCTLGAMLPDLASMAGLRKLEGGSDELRRGIALHHATDALFHRDRAFLGLCAQALEELTSLGVARSSARAVGHVGSELLLDGLLASDASSLRSYRACLSQARELLASEGADGSLRDELSSAALLTLLERLKGAPLPQAYAEPRFVSERLFRILSGRPRLALQPADLPHVQRWLERAQPQVEAELIAVVERSARDERHAATG